MNSVLKTEADKLQQTIYLVNKCRNNLVPKNQYYILYL